MEQKYELILTILNRGFSDLVMDSARKSGATGGTILTARGTGAKEAEKLFGLSLSHEKEIILIIYICIISISNLLSFKSKRSRCYGYF